jgi:hypothetical protein
MAGKAADRKSGSAAFEISGSKMSPFGFGVRVSGG